MTLIEYAKKIRSVIDDAMQTVGDDKSSIAPSLHRRLKQDGSLIPSGTKIDWHGKVKKAAVDLWDREENDPDHAQTLWADIDYKDGYRIIPDVITVSKAFSAGEVGWWTDGLLYKSLVDSNVYTPAQYANNWEVVNG